MTIENSPSWRDKEKTSRTKVPDNVGEEVILEFDPPGSATRANLTESEINQPLITF